ncbi:tRNA (guanosine(46)-N7)-methyltransferase TrmB [Paenactinomyces guangxiensis]|uniref:tRNA (guanine-N(7)-)-methyltransferase n=1 Tax=Paenactinomyces guangxiensis TaxID=1490290 RepID=A0A7W1WMX8_9BACL|nr:tRNA (guanosine(46)-N7)-methyltransferase TrmB [Paenactinomyces guangxiensis]MBA4492847.1 tRNA (guanosine(46)-N7)-methyltransferase TrmB [Paenactinomyces guangxiensis]
MRLRRKPEAKRILAEHPLVSKATDEYRGKWRTLFPHPYPLHVELGTGKGQFLAKASELHPYINWIGVERIEEPLLQAVRKGEKTENTNLRYIWMDIEKLAEVFAEDEVNRFYLHFSDPWPKTRHAKRRLTHRRFLEVYKKLLAPDGDLILKTDSPVLFEFSLEEFAETGWETIEYSDDLHHSPYREQNITTEYEEKFISRGMPIFYTRVKPQSESHKNN